MSAAENNTPRTQVVNNSVKAIIDFYKDPLTLALIELRRSNYSLAKISKTVFKGEISPQAINQNYFKKGKKQ